jgi:hypothetical protein
VHEAWQGKSNDVASMVRMEGCALSTGHSEGLLFLVTFRGGDFTFIH